MSARSRLPAFLLLAVVLLLLFLSACTPQQSSEYSKVYREARRASNPYLCEPLNDREEFSCVYQLASKYDIASCEAAEALTLNSKWGKAPGDDLCYFSIALQEHRTEACDHITTPLADAETGALSSVSRERCIANVAAAYSEPQLCPQLRGESEASRVVLEICLQERGEPSVT